MASLLASLAATAVLGQTPHAGTQASEAEPASRDTAVRIAAFRALLTHARPRLPGAAEPQVWCLAVAGGADPGGAIMTALEDLPARTRPLSECKQRRLLLSQPGLMAPPYNLLSVGPLDWISEDVVEAPASGFGLNTRLKIEYHDGRWRVSTRGWVG